MKLNLHEKRVLITGSSRGIGLAISEAFLEEGARVTLTSRHQSDLDQLKNTLSQRFVQSSILALACEFTDIERIRKLKEQINLTWKGLDILIINLGSGKSVSEPIPSIENFERIFQVNFDSAINTSREFYSLIKESRGSILFIASIAGVEVTGAPTDYSVAKSALIAYSKNLARKAARDGVRVNCIAPGNIYFDGGTWEEKVKADPERIQRLIETTVPLHRFGKPEEIAAAVAFLASERSSFTTGACLIIDGGQTARIF
ncbi:MAG TPA: polyketide synthase [Firmicutes bacterium]|jgi:3-oxoacyl-[acyl-carrier protein] reductase|nr:polyketide synthase [Bacillota bacterium]